MRNTTLQGNNRYKRGWMWATGCGLLLLSVALSGCGGSSDDSSGTATPAAGSKAASTAGGEDTGAAKGGGGTVSNAPPMQTGGYYNSGGMAGPGGMGGTQTAAATAPPASTTKPQSRIDPFAPWWPTQTPPAPVLSQIAPVRIARRDTARPTEQPGIEIQEVPSQRVAGILTGHGIYALLEGPEGNTVVKPGDMIGDYRVASINPDSVTLRKKVGSQTFTQVVPLTDVGSTTQQFSGPAPGGAGGPGIPGAFQRGPGGGIPGFPGGKGRGGGAGFD